MAGGDAPGDADPEQVGGERVVGAGNRHRLVGHVLGRVDEIGRHTRGVVPASFGEQPGEVPDPVDQRDLFDGKAFGPHQESPPTDMAKGGETTPTLARRGRHWRWSAPGPGRE